MNHSEQLARLTYLASERDEIVTQRLDHHPHLHVKVRVRQSVMLILWADAGWSTDEIDAQELGEDAGLIDPVPVPWSCRESPSALLIRESYRGQLCEHEWGMATHFDGQREFGSVQHCSKCGVYVRHLQSRRGKKVSYSYDIWELRPHILRAWMKRGPPPGSLDVRPRDEQKRRNKAEPAPSLFRRHNGQQKTVRRPH